MAAVPAANATAGTQPLADAAIRWRVSAAGIDGILVGIIYGLLCAVLHWRTLTPGHLLAVLGVEFVYFAVQEARSGQTIGKRQYGLRVVSLDGGPASGRAILVRSALRTIDRFPAWYASGLINIVRTGPARRQRIGDVAARTMVIAAEGRSLRRGTPSWVLPTVTLLAVALSFAFLYEVTQAGSQPLSSDQTAAWVAGCERGSRGVVSCGCVLARLEGAGYTSYNALRDFAQRLHTEEASGTPGPTMAALRSAVIACRS